MLMKPDKQLSISIFHVLQQNIIPCKLLEHIVCSNVMAHLDEYQHLSDGNMHLGKGTVVKLS